ncbi:MAG TPA: hypothetical protein VEL48_11480 [Candidatus Acidoferrales bacterium]|nr:hypothetical protein [Candidatus Acidoferrales bacterium]
MAHLQISRTQIEGKDFTLNFDYDQLRDGKISKLSDDGRIEWFRQRMHYIFLEPIGRLFKGKSPAYRELNSSKQTDLPARSFVIASFSVLLNGIEALGSFLTSSRKNDVRFCTFIAKYMSSWDVTVQNSPYSTNDLKKILWKHFRNGIAHGFCIKHGAIDNEADTARGGWRVVADAGPSGTSQSHLEIGPNAFFRDFRGGVDRFFEDVKTDPHHRANFLSRFREIYPN